MYFAPDTRVHLIDYKRKAPVARATVLGPPRRQDSAVFYPVITPEYIRAWWPESRLGRGWAVTLLCEREEVPDVADVGPVEQDDRLGR